MIPLILSDEDIESYAFQFFKRLRFIGWTKEQKLPFTFEEFIRTYNKNKEAVDFG